MYSMCTCVPVAVFPQLLIFFFCTTTHRARRSSLVVHRVDVPVDTGPHTVTTFAMKV